jgi:hypothetical protein
MCSLLDKLVGNARQALAEPLGDGASFLHSVVKRGLLYGAVEQILGSADDLDAIAGRSYRHVNGFTKIVLWEASDTGAKLRVHVWSPHSPSSDVHDHYWDFSSLVLQGAVESTTFEEGEGDQAFARFDLRPSTLGSFSLTSSGTVDLRLVQAATFPVMGVYSLSRDVLHMSTSDPSLGASTFVVQGTRTAERNRVYRPSLRAMRPESMRPEPLDPIILSRLLQDHVLRPLTALQDR